MYQSIVEQRGAIGTFPEFMAERVYMREFSKKGGLPKDLSRWQGVVDDMLNGIETDERLYIMIDQKEVTAGDLHRRGGVHIDGYWCAGLSAHGGGSRPGGAHRGIGRDIGRHSPLPPSHHFRAPRHSPDPEPESGHRPSGRHLSQGYGWSSPDFSVPEGIILAADVSGAVAWRGQYSGEIGDGGDCSTIDVSGLECVAMEAGRVYAGNVSFLHERLPIPISCRRSLVRINARGWSPIGR